MFEWQYTAALIGVTITAVFSFLGILVANGRREKAIKEAPLAVPGAIAGALAERGVADALTNALMALCAEIAASRKAAQQRHDDEDDLRRRSTRLYLDELERIREAITDQGKR